MAFGDFKDLPRRAASDKVLRDKTFHIAKTPKYDRYQCRLHAKVYKSFDSKSSSANTLGDVIKNEIMLITTFGLRYTIICSRFTESNY